MYYYHADFIKLICTALLEPHKFIYIEFYLRLTSLYIVGVNGVRTSHKRRDLQSQAKVLYLDWGEGERVNLTKRFFIICLCEIARLGIQVKTPTDDSELKKRGMSTAKIKLNLPSKAKSRPRHRFVTCLTNSKSQARTFKIENNSFQNRGTYRRKMKQKLVYLQVGPKGTVTLFTENHLDSVYPGADTGT